MVTCFSCMASRSAACVFGGALLISSDRSRLQKIGPGLNVNSPFFASYMLVPVMSAGSKSGVNWTRLKSHPRASAKVFVIRVLARPG